VGRTAHPQVGDVPGCGVQVFTAVGEPLGPLHVRVVVARAAHRDVHALLHDHLGAAQGAGVRGTQRHRVAAVDMAVHGDRHLQVDRVDGGHDGVAGGEVQGEVVVIGQP